MLVLVPETIRGQGLLVLPEDDETIGVLCYRRCTSYLSFCASVVCIWTFPYLAVLFPLTP